MRVGFVIKILIGLWRCFTALEMGFGLYLFLYLKPRYKHSASELIGKRQKLFYNAVGVDDEGLFDRIMY